MMATRSNHPALSGTTCGMELDLLHHGIGYLHKATCASESVESDTTLCSSLLQASLKEVKQNQYSRLVN